MDPQKKIWKPDPGHKYKLTNNKAENCDSFSPFQFSHHCGLKHYQQFTPEERPHYDGTIIRFPLRNKESDSDISKKFYTVAMLNSLLQALKDDAAILLLFLRYVEKIEVFTINTSNTVSKIFSVQMDKSTEVKRRKQKIKFLKDVKKYHSDPSAPLPRLHYETTVTVHDVQAGTQSVYQWVVMHWVGSRDRDVLDASCKVSSLPWIGFAVPLTLQCPSRLFCFLPLPNSKEVNPPLPVCVHGTFGLNKDRRHLKWITSDMKNDDGALWNDLLLSKMLPSCYADCLKTLKSKCKPEAFYSFWPHTSTIKKTNWKIGLNPLLSLLLQEELFWSLNGSWVKLAPSVCVVPQVNSSQFPKIIVDALIRCNKTVVVLPDNVWEAVKFIYRSSYPFTAITSTVVRKVLKSSPQSYANFSKAEKFQLLHYCLEDKLYPDLIGLVLLPALDGTFVTFASNHSQEKMYVCKKKFVETKLLANTTALLVCLEDEDEVLHMKLTQMAENKSTQVQVLKPDVVALLLRQSPPFENGWCLYGSAGGFYNEDWLKTFWRWVNKHSLLPFVGISLIPICNEKTSNGFKVIPLLQKGKSKLLKFSSSVGYDQANLVSAAGKLGCYLTSSDEFEFLYHSELKNCHRELLPSHLLSISSQSAYQSVTFTQEEAMTLRQFLFQYRINLNTTQKSVVLCLPMFSTIQKGTLHSVQQAKCTVGGKSASLLVIDTDHISKYLSFFPPNPLILTCEKSIGANVRSILQGVCWAPTKPQLISNVILVGIENKQLTRDCALKVTSLLLEPGEFHSLADEKDGNLFVDKLKSLRFLPTGQKTDLFLPREVFDPTDHVVKELFAGQNVFPVAPFSQNHFSILKQLGMKDSTSLSASDAVNVVNLICGNTGGTQSEISRACKFMEYLSSPTGNRLLNEYYNNRPLDQTLRSLQWLPVITTPPKSYPKCLGWKGSSGSQFVSAQSLHASSSPQEHKKLPSLIGSQMKILNYGDSLSVNLMASLKIPQNVPVDAMIQHFLNLINHKTEIDRQKVNAAVKLLYMYLQQAADNNQTSQYWQQLSQSEVVQVSDNKFVLPSVVACCFDEKCMTVGKLEPYWYILPSDLQQFRSLFCYIGAKDKVTMSDVLFVFKKMASVVDVKIKDLELVKNILQWLCSQFTSDELLNMHEHILIPVDSEAKNKLVLKPANKVAFLDEDLMWVKDDKEALADIIKGYFLVHPSISYDMACKLQLNPLNTEIANAEEFCYEQAGQSEPLTNRLNRILREYKDTSVIQELLQNADDAGATEVAIYYDTRKHDSSHLFFPGMANSYGPALLFYNNAEFRDEDFANIRKIAGETKINKPLKIGKFGVGFCSVYHITDVPSFVSGESFIVFDPTLQCLGKEIKDKSNPGIKVNFNKFIPLKNSKQLNPYTGICGFNPKEPFQGTLFRFPLRLKSSSVSGNVYTETKVHYMVNSIRENSSKLLMFLNSVKRVSFYQSRGDGFTKHFEINVSKENIYNLISCQVLVGTIVPSTEHREEKWLIATDAQQLQVGRNEQKHATASVSVQLSDDSTTNKFHVNSIRGECFCFLPLNIETGLPVHVSSNFAVMTNRRGIWKADNVGTTTKESNWNRLLMESVVVQAYIKLLLCLQQMQQNGSLVNYTFHSLWPVSLRELNPWEFLMNELYAILFSSQHSLFYSEVMRSWKKLNECNFLSKLILQIGFNRQLYESIYHVSTMLKLPVVHLPDQLMDKLRSNASFKSRIIGEKQFIRHFYNDNTLSKVSVEDKTEIVAASLILYANDKHSPAMPELIKGTKCIPCSPDGTAFKKPQEIIDPNSNIAKLFSPDDGMFPDQTLLTRSNLLIISLSKIGLMKSLPWELCIDRAKCVQKWYCENAKEALNYLVVLIECIKDNSAQYLPSKTITQELQRISFLPVMKKPAVYPIKWKGDGMPDLLAGPELVKVEGSVNVVFACGSRVAILDTHCLSLHLTHKVQMILGINQEIDINHVVGQFDELLKWFQSNSSNTLSRDLLNYTNSVAHSIYRYLLTKFNTIRSDNLFQKRLSSLKEKPCIWNGKQFLKPSCVCFSWETSGPYLYKFPEMLDPFVELMQHLGVESDFPSTVMLNALQEMKRKYQNNEVPDDCQTIVRLILPKLFKCKIRQGTDIFLPDVDFILRNAKELKYNDAPWCDPGEEYVYCHECVERTVAVHLGVELVKKILLEDLEVTGDDWEQEFGQEEKLTQRLNNILRDYPYDITFLKELLQNADDAGATKLYIILDKRCHSNEKVISEEWKALHGPALLFWNNSPFSDEDLLGIQKIGLGSKRDDADKIGQYGIGFNVVYHFTDCPSFVTNDQLCIMDPHYRYIARKRMKPGKMFKGLETLWKRFPDMKSPYLLNDLDHLPAEMKAGSLFRLPLRVTREAAEQSDIVGSNGFFAIDKLETDLKEWVPEMQEALLFVHNVCDIRLFVIESDDVNSVGIMKWKDPQPVVLCSHVESSKRNKRVTMDSGNCKLVTYNMKLADKRKNTEVKWLIQLGEGDPLDDAFDWKGAKPPDIEVRPQHGIAAPLIDKSMYFSGRSFCFLPLLDYTRLPVHIHGQFILHSDRRGLWASGDNDSHKTTDPKKRWNDRLIKAIAASYSYFLEHCIMHDRLVCIEKKAKEILDNYYKLFPIIKSIPLEQWKTLAKEVYLALSKLNPLILASMIDEGKDGDDKLYAVQWSTLHLPGAPNEGYFHDFYSQRSNSFQALKTIGMNLVATPMFIQKQFKEVEIILPEISQKSVLKYYVKYHNDIINQNKLPCDISSTKFGNVECFVAFVKYVSIHSSTVIGSMISDPKDGLDPKDGSTSVTQAEGDRIPTQDLQNAGFLITVNENLHCLSDGERIICSKSWNLFPESDDTFLHEDLIIECTGTQNIFQPSESGEGYDLIQSVFSANLPSSWCGVDRAPLEDFDTSLIESLLQCICGDPAFKPYCSQVLKQFALIPADNKMMYSKISDLLPMTTTILSISICVDFKKLELLLRNLEIPFIDSTVYASSLVGTDISLPNISNPNEVLKSIFLVRDDCHDKITGMNDEEMELLFEVFKTLSFSSSEYPVLTYLKQLPIFKTIHGHLVQLSSTSTVWIWNEKVCKVGIAEWIDKIPTSEVFLDPQAPWKALKSHAEILGISDISLYELYCNYIFPHFSTMESAMRVEHLKFISQRVFFGCKYHSVDKFSDQHSMANKFIAKLKCLKCIGDNYLALRTIDSFYDHTQEMFTVFCDDNCFLPKELQDSEMQECLKFFGLRTVPTADDFLKFCNQVAKFCSTATCQKASRILLNCIFQNNPDHQHLYSETFLRQVSAIPIAVVKDVPKLNAIKAQKLGECSVRDESTTITLTKLSESSLVKNKHSVWTCKPLVELPVHLDNVLDVQRLKTLGVSVVPKTSDVIHNLKVLASTEFSDNSRFHKQTSCQVAEISDDLPDTVVKMMECINQNIKRHNQEAIDEYNYEQLNSEIGDLKILPAKLQVSGYALVKPIQVLVMEKSQLAPFYPFLHPLIVQANSVLQILNEIGVNMSFDFSHMQLVLKLAKELGKDSKVDYNLKRTVAKATVELTQLLRNSENQVISLMPPLYLLNDQGILTDSSSLVVFDISSVHRPVLPPELTYLNSLRNMSTTRFWNPEELLQLLPERFGLKSLKSIMQYTMIDATPMQYAYSHVSAIEQILKSTMFKSAIEGYASYCTHNPEPPEEVKQIVANFQTKLKVQYLKEVQLRPQLNLDNKVIPLENTVFQDFFFEYCNEEYILSLKNTSTTYPSHTFLKLSGSLCLTLKLKATKCFETVEDSGIPELSTFVSAILSCGNISKIGTIIKDSLPGIDSIEQEMVDSEPVLGEAIPECWHHRLDQNIFNFFMPQELVGYETETNDIIYAQVLYCNDTKSNDDEDNVEQIFQLKYTITIGNDTELEVTVLQLYKFVSAVKDPVAQDSSSAELEIHDTGNSESAKQARHARVAGGKEAIRAAVKAAWKLPEDQKRKAIKRLYLQYHPDKNPDNPNATAEFQFLLQELERMEKGYPEEPLDAEQPFRPPSSFNFGWSGWFYQWDQTAFSHRNYRSRDRAWGRSSRGGAFWGGGGGGGWQTPKPQTNHSEAVRWIKQAEYDYASLSTLMTSSQTDEKTCASTCFMCHEVAEKSLKAGMYAKCGMAGDTTLKNHNVVTPARALIQMGCEINVDDAIFLEHFYSHPRFPYCHPPPTVPGEKYVSSTARKAFDAATRIYEVIKQLLDDEE